MGDEPSPPQQPPAPAPVEPTHLRRANPATVLLPRTVRWIESLPSPVRPAHLAAQYARIANQLCAKWDDRADCASYFDDLLADRRGDRAGFPVRILKELQALKRHFEAVGGRQAKDGWEDAR
jgi:hypothetical protein